MHSSTKFSGICTAAIELSSTSTIISDVLSDSSLNPSLELSASSTDPKLTVNV